MKFSRKWYQYQGIGRTDVYFTNDMKKSHGKGNIVAAVTCINKTSKPIFNTKHRQIDFTIKMFIPNRHF